MFWTFVATVFCGLGAAGIALSIRAITRKKAPKWIIPAFAGAGMLGYLIYMEYTWFDLKQTQLPEEAVVVSTEEYGAPWRPWAYVVPQVAAFTVLDTKSVVRDDPEQNIVRFSLYRFEQSYTDAVSQKMYLLNCDTRELVPLNSEKSLDTSALRILSEDDQLLALACDQ
ncbi:MAG: hypothetical protein ABJM11_09000 [Marinobacter sp.]|uniref:hypothetical protein n=1 Tax=Marinobacter sp. TaxID=50741 RepID=UPI003299E02C